MVGFPSLAPKFIVNPSSGSKPWLRRNKGIRLILSQWLDGVNYMVKFDDDTAIVANKLDKNYTA